MDFTSEVCVGLILFLGNFFDCFSVGMAHCPGGFSLFVSDGGSDIFWVCKTLSGIPLGPLFG